MSILPLFLLSPRRRRHGPLEVDRPGGVNHRDVQLVSLRYCVRVLEPAAAGGARQRGDGEEMVSEGVDVLVRLRTLGGQDVGGDTGTCWRCGAIGGWEPQEEREEVGRAQIVQACGLGSLTTLGTRGRTAPGSGTTTTVCRGAMRTSRGSFSSTQPHRSTSTAAACIPTASKQ